MGNKISQKIMISSGKFDEEKKYWLNKLSGELTLSSFSNNYPNMDFAQNKREKVTFYFPAEVYARFLRIGGASGYGVFIILLTGLNCLIYKYTGNDDIIVGVPILKQKVSGTYFNDILALRDRVTGDMTFKEMAQQVKNNFAEANENANYPLDEITKLLNLSTPDNYSSLFDIVIALKNIHGDAAHNEQRCGTIFTFNLNNDSLEGEINYNSTGFDSRVIESLCCHYLNCLTAATGNPGIKLYDIEILSAEEKNQILFDFNNTGIDYPRRKGLYGLFADQVMKSPNSTAVGFEDRKLTYNELNRRANQTARMLKAVGVGSGDIVGFMIPRSEALVIGIMGILKANAVCLPLDISYPEKRIDGILSDSSAKFLLQQKGYKGRLSFPGVTINLDHLHEDFVEISVEPGIHQSNLLAYIIYTSGSTGKPKGTPLCHSGIINHVFTKIRELGLGQDDICCQNLNITFVASIWQFFAPLFTGNQLHIYPQDVVSDPYAFFRKVEDDHVSVVEVVPSLLNTYIELLEEGKARIELTNLRVLVLTGEKVIPRLVNRFYKYYGIDLINAYGQSECSDDTLHYKIPYNLETSTVPIGSPANNTQVYILGIDGHLLPAGVWGELYIGGDGLAAGYLNRPELTAEKFIDVSKQGDLFSSLHLKLNTKHLKLFRTGDIARWLSDGSVEFLGRIDHQVKIRGYRIELDEIASQLMKHDKIKKAVLMVRGDDAENKYLCAYMIPTETAGSVSFPTLALSTDSADSSDSEIPFNSNVLRTYLSRELPDYMIPSYFLLLEKIPLKPNGKVDWNALPDPRKFKLGEKPGELRDEVEKKLITLWAEVLKIEEDRLDSNSDFFQLGGNSLRSVTLVAKIHEELDVNLSLTEIFDFPTIKGLGEYIRKTSKDKHVSIEPAEEKEYYPLSSAQEGLFFLQQMDPESITYNMFQFIPLGEDVKKEKLEDVFKKLIARHGSLRTSFEMIDGQPVQKINDKMVFAIEGCDVCSMDMADAAPGERLEKILKSFIRPFDLFKAPLLKVGITKLNKERQILLLDMHHIIMDGMSQQILKEEFLELYEGKKLLPLKLHYKDFSEWLNREEQIRLLKKQEEYWLNVFSDELPVLNLPTDYKRPPVQSFEGGGVLFALNEDETRSLKEISEENDATLYMTIFSIFHILLSKLSGQEDIVVGMHVAGRHHADLEKVIGMFVNALPVRIFSTGNQTFKMFFRDVKKQVSNALENQAYAFEDLVKKILEVRDASRNPLFDAACALNNIIGKTTIDSLDDVAPPAGRGDFLFERNDDVTAALTAAASTTKFDFYLMGMEAEDRLLFTFQYCTKLFKQETVERYVKYFKEIICIVARDRDILLEDILISHDLLAPAQFAVEEEKGDFGF